MVDRQMQALTIQHYPDACFTPEHMPCSPLHQSAERAEDFAEFAYGLCGSNAAQERKSRFNRSQVRMAKTTLTAAQGLWDRTLPTPCLARGHQFVSLTPDRSGPSHGIPEYLAEDAEFVQGDVQDSSL